MYAYNINWDVSKTSTNLASLPTAIKIPEYVNFSMQDISDYISDSIGFTPYSFSLKDSTGFIYSSHELEILKDIKEYLVYEEQVCTDYSFKKKWNAYTDREKRRMVTLLSIKKDSYGGYGNTDIYLAIQEVDKEIEKKEANKKQINLDDLKTLSDFGKTFTLLRELAEDKGFEFFISFMGYC